MEKTWDKIREWVMIDVMNENDALYKVSTGLGKTTSTLQVMRETFGPANYKWGYIAPTHKVIKDSVEMGVASDSTLFLIDDHVHLKGRSLKCSIPMMREKAKKNIDIGPWCRHRCQIRESRCSYYKMINKVFEDHENFAAVHSHLTNLFKRIKDIPDYDCIIIDENPLDALIDSKIISISDLNKTKLILASHELDSETCDYLMAAILELIGGLGISIDYGALSECFIAESDAVSFKRLLEKFISDLISNDDKIDIDISIIRILTDILASADSDSIKHMIYLTPDKTRVKLNYYNSGIFRGCPFTLIFLDGTGNKGITEKLVGKDIKVRTRSYKYRRIYQRAGCGEWPLKSWSMSSMHDSKYFKRQLNLLEIISNNHEKVLLCGTKKFFNLVEPYLEERNINNFKKCNFYNLRSRNDYYKGTDALIIPMKPSPPRQEIEHLSYITGISNQAIVSMYIRDEIIQAIGRLRQPKNKDSRIYLLSSSGLKLNGGEYKSEIMEEITALRYKDFIDSIKLGNHVAKPAVNRLADKVVEYIKVPRNKLEIRKHFNISATTLMTVLRILSEEGRLRRAKQGRNKYISVQPKRIRED